MNVFGIHGPVKEQDVDEFTGPVGVPVNPAGGGLESLMRAGKRTGLRCPGQSSRAGTGPGFGFEGLKTVVELDRLTESGGER